MPCFKPLNVWQRVPGAQVTFSPTSPDDRKLRIPCGQCIGCRLRRSQEWAARIVHEASESKNNAFVTLTYEHVPYGGTLVKRHLQLFMKRLRKRVPQKVRFFGVGEYGEQTKRPHYHVVLFNYWPQDAEYFRDINGNRYYVSNELSELWPRGHHLCGHVTFDSAAYCARYCTKKITGAAANEHYEQLVEETGEIIQREPEFAVMSRRPGIGKDWFAKYRDDVFPSDEVIVKGRQIKPPRYYDKLFELEDECGFSKVKALRTEAAANDEHSTTKRLRDREEVTEAQLKLKRRML